MRLPNPVQAHALRLPKICKKLVTFEKSNKNYSQEEKEELQRIKDAVIKCDTSENAPVVIYISKMITAPPENINEHGLIPLSQVSKKTKFVGFARIFSGKIKRGDSAYLISSRKNKKE